MAPIYTNFEGERAPKKTRFFCQNFSKSAQRRLFDFFQNFAGGAEKLAKKGAKQCFERARKNQFGRPKKKGHQNFGKMFENPPPPPRENPRSAPGHLYTFTGAIFGSPLQLFENMCFVIRLLISNQNNRKSNLFQAT